MTVWSGFAGYGPAFGCGVGVAVGCGVVGDVGGREVCCCCCWCLGCRGRGEAFEDVFVRGRVGPVGSATGRFAARRAVVLVGWRDVGGHDGVGGQVGEGGVWVVVIAWEMCYCSWL